MSVPTMDELVALREEISSLEVRRAAMSQGIAPSYYQANAHAGVERDIVNKRLAMLDVEYSMKLREFIEAGAVEGVRP